MWAHYRVEVTTCRFLTDFTFFVTEQNSVAGCFYKHADRQFDPAAKIHNGPCL